MNNLRLSALHLSHLADQAERFMLVSYERLSHSLVLHNDAWANALAGHALEIALRRPGVSPDLPHLARAAALLEACRYWGTGPQLRDWAEVSREFRNWTGPDYAQLQLTLAAALPGGESTLRREVADVLYDAQLAQRILSGTEGAELNWLENRYGTVSEEPLGRLSALSRYLDELRTARFRDGELRRGYQHTHSAVLLDLQKLVDRLEKKRLAVAPAAPVATAGLTELERGPTRQAAQTYFRTVFRNQVQLKRMADHKAAILVGIDAVSIAAVLAFAGRYASRPEFLLPVAVFIACALTSLVYAIIASRPYDRAGEEENLAFHGTISGIGREEFGGRMEKMLVDPDALYGNLIADLHGLATATTRTYRLLRVAYNVFLFGLLCGVLIAMGMLLWA